jgi:arsenate reductase (glutaredoxin)
MSVTIYHNPDCGTSSNVLGLIRNSGEEPHIIEYLKTPPSRDELVDLVSRMGISVRDLLRRKGTPYDDLNLDNPALTNDQLIDAMMAHPILINRPIVITPEGVKLCRPSEAVLDILPPLWSIRHKTANSLCDLNGLQTASINDRRASRKPLK